jgi:hypothetical protein
LIRRKFKGWLLIYITAVTVWSLTGCYSMPSPAPLAVTAPTPPPPEIVHAQAQDALPALVIAERQASVAGDLALLRQLWAADGRVVDARNTTDAADDYIWPGRAAVLDRYVVAVFPNPPPPLEALPDAAIEKNGDQTRLLNGHDLWIFTWREGRWWIAELIYNRP